MIFDFVQLEPDRFQRFHLTTLQVVCKRWNRLLERRSSYWISTLRQALGLLRKLRKDHGAVMVVRRLHLEYFTGVNLEVTSAASLFNEILFSCSQLTRLKIGFTECQTYNGIPLGISHGLQSLKEIVDFEIDDGYQLCDMEYDW